MVESLQKSNYTLARRDDLSQDNNEYKHNHVAIHKPASSIGSENQFHPSRLHSGYASQQQIADFAIEESDESQEQPQPWT